MGGYGPGFGMMGGFGGGAMFPFTGIFGLLILVLVIVAVVWFVSAVFHPRETAQHTGRYGAGLEVLEARYSRGEINREEYQQKRTDLRG